MGALSRVSGFATLPIWSIPPTNIYLSIDYIEVTLVALPRISRGYSVGVILRVSQPGWGQTAQSLYALKLRTTIIGYVPPLVVVWESQASPRRDIPASFRSSLILPLVFLFGFRIS